MAAGSSIADRVTGSPARPWVSAPPVLLAVVGSVALAAAGWHGKDYSASLYRIDQFRHHGIVVTAGWSALQRASPNMDFAPRRCYLFTGWRRLRWRLLRGRWDASR